MRVLQVAISANVVLGVRFIRSIAIPSVVGDVVGETGREPVVGDPVPVAVGEVVMAHLVAAEVVGDVERNALAMSGDYNPRIVVAVVVVPAGNGAGTRHNNPGRAVVPVNLVTDGDVKVFLFLFRISRTGSFGSQSVTASDQHKPHRHVGVCSTQPNQTPVGRAPHP